MAAMGVPAEEGIWAPSGSASGARRALEELDEVLALLPEVGLAAGRKVCPPRGTLLISMALA